MLVVVVVWLIAVFLLLVGYTLVWLLSPQSRAWMEAPGVRFLEQERRVRQVVHERPPPAAKTDDDNAIEQLRRHSDGKRNMDRKGHSPGECQERTEAQALMRGEVAKS
jgi:hypothetical protein